MLSDDEEYAERQNIRCLMNALKRYFETHLAIKAQQMRRLQEGSSQIPNFPNFKPIRLSPMQVNENVEAMFEMLPFKSRWTAVDDFVQLGGVIKCFQVKRNKYFINPFTQIFPSLSRNPSMLIVL